MGSLVENWLIFVTRGGKTWPSWKLVGAIFLVDVISTLFCIFGWLHGGLHRCLIWCYSIGVTIVVAIVYFLLLSIKWIDNLGRVSWSRLISLSEGVSSRHI